MASDQQLSAAEVVKQARSDDKTDSWPLINQLVTDFHEFHGDRNTADDPAIIAGIGYLLDKPLTLIATQKGHDVKSRLATHFGSPEPWGYRKAIRLMREAEKFHRPVLTLINTPGAFPGVDAEQAGQGEAIASSIATMMSLKVPVIAVIFGEGGSGGALALASSDRVWMTAHSEYAVLSPEGFASILWKDAKRSAEAAEVMGLTPHDLLDAGVVEQILPEPLDIAGLKQQLFSAFSELFALSPEQLVEQRYQRFRKF
ncbi:carboxyltransferase subunit alpha [Oenococcus sicerae]|uniref:acetyl-CoA carboxytransferase n=1 Tax=Oenococcus sicerae TaxID=2203724 RepID=A0AAJ1RES0_9LACO|nr:carboxyltransferase subunit alpha [Oenococcus sicerae]MDN6900566.1 acetyl-CoA carboxylase carboxyl transferase subunit alpha [Oenococcus sicerae]VDK14146.1 Acetyl-coenzyme A carboxylase carboxyl transferase subunit alpha {ECO:0000255/HAMAP-Rule:MF_00823} [Oenococcus sicerae]